MNITKRQLSYYKRWEVKRKSKLQYILKNGLLYWALPFSILMILFDLIKVRFKFSQNLMIDFLVLFGIASAIEILGALYFYRAHEKQ